MVGHDTLPGAGALVGFAAKPKLPAFRSNYIEMKWSTWRLIILIASVWHGSAFGDSCSSSDMEATETALYDHAGALNSCTVNLCEERCVSAMEEATSDLPNCEYIEGLNYYEIMTQSVQACESRSTSSNSSEVSSASTEASNSTNSSVAACSQTEISTTSALLAQNSDVLATSCARDLVCSTDCIALMTELQNSLPDCVFFEGVSYYGTFNATVAGCLAGGATTSSAVGSNSNESSVDTISGSVGLTTTTFSAVVVPTSIGLMLVGLFK